MTADELKETEPKAIMLRIADDYDRLAEWAEKMQLGELPRVARVLFLSHQFICRAVAEAELDSIKLLFRQ